jgi:hypothetical protein
MYGISNKSPRFSRKAFPLLYGGKESQRLKVEFSLVGSIDPTLSKN